MADTYLELLRNPRWQRKRLEIMSRDDFACTVCGDRESTLNVHHKRYRKGAKPWQYADDDLTTLCENCHGKVTDLRKEIGAAISDAPPATLEIILGFIHATIAGTTGGGSVDAPNKMRLKGMAQACGRDWKELECGSYNIVDARK